MWKIDSVDSLAIVDKNFKVLHSYRCNPRFDDDITENMYLSYINKSFFEIYPDLSQAESTMFESIKNNRVVYKENQVFTDYLGRVFHTTNLTIPLVRQGEIIGAIELSKDITSIDDLEQFPNLKQKKESKNIQKIDSEKYTFDDILTVNEVMVENIRRAKIFANSPSPTLIYGETGTGKELFAQAMVNHSDRNREKFIALSCATIPENLLESLLFGSIKGAYTGAIDRLGLFEQAHKGILFLDELNSITLQVQAKLLRVLQNGVVRKLGSGVEKKVDVKVIGAMNCDPLVAIEKGILREDLFYRFSGNLIHLVPLRERREDIPIYLDFFIRNLNGIYGKDVEGISRALMDLFLDYDWKGNVRELKHILESMISITAENTLTIKHLPLYMIGSISQEGLPKMKSLDVQIPMLSLQEVIDKTERELIVQALIWTKGHLTKSAEILGIPRQTLKYRIKKLGLEIKDYKQKKK